MAYRIVDIAAAGQYEKQSATASNELRQRNSSTRAGRVCFYIVPSSVTFFENLSTASRAWLSSSGAVFVTREMCVYINGRGGWCCRGPGDIHKRNPFFYSPPSLFSFYLCYSSPRGLSLTLCAVCYQRGCRCFSPVPMELQMCTERRSVKFRRQSLPDILLLRLSAPEFTVGYYYSPWWIRITADISLGSGGPTTALQSAAIYTAPTHSWLYSLCVLYTCTQKHSAKICAVK